MKDLLASLGLTDSPQRNLDTWLADATRAGQPEPTAMTLSTLSGEMPRSRVVLFKGWHLVPGGEHGPSFYTNYNSAKAGEIEKHTAASLCFYWGHLARQVRIEGYLQKVSTQDSDEYFATRPRESQIGAWASLQSQVIPNRKWLEDRFKSYEQQFEGKTVPRPENWGGYVLSPSTYEFWIGRPSRLHDRIRFQRSGTKWVIDLLSP